MNRAQYFVLAWIYFTIASAVLLRISRVVTHRLKQPADRIRLIYFTLLSLTATPLLLVLAPWSIWKLPLMSTATESPSARVIMAPSARARPSNLTDGGMAALSPLGDQTAGRSDDSNLGSISIGSSPSSENAASTLSNTLVRHRAGDWEWLALSILMLHVAVVVYSIIEWALGSIWLRKISRTARNPTDQMLSLWDRVSSGRGRHVRLLVSNSIDSPLMYGWLRPVILLPGGLLNASESTLTFCLAHEWCHVERGDLLGWHGVRLCQCLLGELPIYWTLRRELRLQQDMLADDRSTRAKRDAVEYSELLLGFARSRMPVPMVGALTFSDQPCQLTKRIKMLLENNTAIRFQSSWKFSFAAATGTFLFAFLIGSVRLSAPLSADDSKKDVQPQSNKPAAKETADRSEATMPTAKQPENLQEPKEQPALTPDSDGALVYTCRVVDKETGKGLANARIKFRRSILNSQGNKLIEETKHVTDGDGKYQVTISAEHAAIGGLHILLDVEHDDYVAKKGFGYELSMIRKNEKMGERPFFEKIDLYPAESVTGTVVSPDGQLLAGVKVQTYSMANRRDSQSSLFEQSSSFNQTVTGADGRFQINVHKAADAVIWLLPKDYAPIEKFLAKPRGDQGTMRLTDGIRVSGQVKSAEGKLLPGIAVDIHYAGERDLGGLQDATEGIKRRAVSNENGQFTFNPLPPGNYTVTPSVHHAVPSVFTQQKVVLTENTPKQDVIVQAVPHVIMSGQIYNSKGEKHSGDQYPVVVNGQLDGGRWIGMRDPDKDGAFEVKIPHGIQKTFVQLFCKEHHALRYRLGPDQSIQNTKTNDPIDFGTINDDVSNFEIIYYEAPIVLLAVVDEEKKPIKDARISAAYLSGEQRYVLKDEMRSDLRFEHQTDGRHRTMHMLPDEEVTFKATAAGYEPASEKMKLAEGKTKELVLTLKKAGTAADEK